MAICESSDTIKTLQHFCLLHLVSFCFIMCEKKKMSEVLKFWKNAYCNFMLKIHIIFSYNLIFSLIGLIWRGKGFWYPPPSKIISSVGFMIYFWHWTIKIYNQPLTNFHEQANGMSLKSIGCMNDDIIQCEIKDQNPNT